MLGLGSVTQFNITTQVSGVLPTVNGGTGVKSTATFPSSGTVVSAASALTSNAVMIGGGLGASSTISAATNTAYALFATAGAPAFRQAAAADLSDGVTGSGAVVLKAQSTINAFSLNQLAALATPAAPTLADISGSGSLVANTTYKFQCVAANLVGNSIVSPIASITTANDGQPHKVSVTCPTITGAVAYGYYGRTSGSVGGNYFMSACTAAGAPIAACTSATAFVDDGTITPANLANSNNGRATSLGIGWGPTTGSPTGQQSNATLNDTWLTRVGPGELALSIAGFGDVKLDFCYMPTAGYACPNIGATSSNGHLLSSVSMDVTGTAHSSAAVTAGTYVSATTYMSSAVQTAVLSGGNATATCAMANGNTCWIKPVGGTNVTTLTVTGIVANGLGYDFCVTQDGTGGSTVTFAAAPFHGSWTPGTTLSKSSCAHFSSPDGTNLYLTGHTENQ